MLVTATRRPSIPRRTLARATACALLLAGVTGCGDDAAPEEAAPTVAPDAAPPGDDVTEADDDRDGPERPGDTEEVADAPATGPSGTVTLEGITYEMDRVTRCATDGEELAGFGELDLDLFALGEDDAGDRTSIFVQVGELSGAAFESVSWDGPEGTWGEPQAIDIDLADDRVTGTATLVDALTFEGSLEIAFDLPVPADEERC